MKIGFAGVHGSGKTSLAKYLVDEVPEFSKFIYVPSSARRLENKLAINKDATPYSQLMITVSRIADEEQLSDGGRSSLLCDRTPLDSLAYTYYQNQNAWKSQYDEMVKASELLVRRAMRDYDLVVYFPAYWEPEDDGTRLTDVEYQKMIGLYMMMYMNRFGIKPYIMTNEPVDKRALHLVKWLARRK
jgi:deoxyadenosine/deoxycytidine kinase